LHPYPIRTHGLSHIHLSVASIERAEQFYRTVLGAEPRFVVGKDLAFLRTPGTNDLIALHADRREKSGGIDHFGFQLVSPNDLDSAVCVVKAAGGVVVKRGTHVSPSHRDTPYVLVSDVDGYTVELLASDP